MVLPRSLARSVPFLLVVLLLASCGESSSESADTTVATTTTEATTTTTTTTAAPTTTTTATTTTPEGSKERTIVVGGDSRSYLLFIPPALDPASPAPLVVNLHGYTESARSQEYRNFNKTAESEGIVVVYPDAVHGAWDMEGTSDIEFITAIIDEVSTLTAIDADKVYSIGYSQGGAFSTFLACRPPDRITAVASVAALLHHDLPACPTPSPARVLTFVGETDTTYSIEEGLLIWLPDPDLPGPLAEETGAWVVTNGCDGEPGETSLPDGVMRKEYDCANGSALVVYIHPGGHIWPVGQSAYQGFELDANAIIWEFLDQYTAPLPTE